MRKIMVDLRRCVGCNSCQIACAVEHSTSKDLHRAPTENPRPKNRVKVKDSYRQPFPLRCEHCGDAPCIDACKTGAMARDTETGAVQIDEKKCVGCWMCVMVCPFGAVFPDFAGGKAVKCDLCRGRNTPACVEACPTKALELAEAEKYKAKPLAPPSSAVRRTTEGKLAGRRQ